jgi:hypothetical protein
MFAEVQQASGRIGEPGEPSPTRLHFSPFCNLSPCPLCVDRWPVVLPSASAPLLRLVVTLHSGSYYTRSPVAPAFTDRFTIFRWAENAAPRITSEQQRVVGY